MGHGIISCREARTTEGFILCPYATRICWVSTLQKWKPYCFLAFSVQVLLCDETPYRYLSCVFYACANYGSNSKGFQLFTYLYYSWAGPVLIPHQWRGSTVHLFHNLEIDLVFKLVILPITTRWQTGLGVFPETTTDLEWYIFCTYGMDIFFFLMSKRSFFLIVFFFGGGVIHLF